MKLIDKKVALMKKGSLAYLTQKQVKEIAQAYPEFVLIEAIPPYPIPKNQTAYKMGGNA